MKLLNPKEQAQLLIMLGFATGHGMEVDLHSIIRTLNAKRKKSDIEKQKLLEIIAYTKDNGILELFSHADIQMLESAIKFEI